MPIPRIPEPKFSQLLKKHGELVREHGPTKTYVLLVLGLIGPASLYLLAAVVWRSAH